MWPAIVVGRLMLQADSRQQLLSYYAVGILILFLVFFIVRKRYRSKARQGRIYINKQAASTGDEYRKIALGALYSEQQAAYINSIDTGLDHEVISNIAGNWWQVNNGKEAVNTLNYLSDKGFDYYFPAVVAARNIPETERLEFLRDSFDSKEDAEKALSQLNHLEESYPELQSSHIIKSDADIVRLGVSGWDAGRLVFMARLFYNAGYITLQQAWSYIDHAQSVARANFNSWHDFACSYILGRAMWGGKNAGNTAIITIARYLLKDPQSPWVRLAW